MVCDDEEIMRKCIISILNKISKQENREIKVYEAQNGIECLHEIYREVMNGQGFDGLFIDETMPFMRGSLCINIIRKLSEEKQINNIKICSITAYTDEQMLNYIKSQGADMILKKPPSTNDIKLFIQTFVIS